MSQWITYHTFENSAMCVGIQHECHFGQSRRYGGVSVMSFIIKKKTSLYLSWGVLGLSHRSSLVLTMSFLCVLETPIAKTTGGTGSLRKQSGSSVNPQLLQQL